MRIRSRYRQIITASGMLILVGAVLFVLGGMFTQAQPLRDVDYFDNYSGEKTYCRTINHYANDEAKLARLVSYADNNAMDYLMWRFGKEKGRDMVSTCEKARRAHIIERCAGAEELSVEQVVLEYNRERIKQKGLI
ncbi:hypothetical protein [Ferrimonas pelagia]|uniref:Uncharacterized protein n=1 Tax=Ferrimonas pelagia TaxID=1177826 RepID=A0ABP9EIS7_9GAMM